MLRIWCGCQLQAGKIPALMSLAFLSKAVDHLRLRGRKTGTSQPFIPLAFILRHVLDGVMLLSFGAREPGLFAPDVDLDA